MTGLEKIIKEIRDEAAAEAAAQVAKAKEQAQAILTEAKEEAGAKARAIQAQTDKDVADIQRSRESAQQLQHRQRTLQTKQAVLAETLDKALASLYDLPAEKYFSLLVLLAAASAQPGAGEMLLNEADQKRLPADFDQKLAAALPKGSSLTVAGTTRPIDGGFVLKYGDVEENCSFKAIFDARREEFSDRIRPVLFGEA